MIMLNVKSPQSNSMKVRLIIWFIEYNILGPFVVDKSELNVGSYTMWDKT